MKYELMIENDLCQRLETSISRDVKEELSHIVSGIYIGLIRNTMENTKIYKIALCNPAILVLIVYSKTPKHVQVHYFSDVWKTHMPNGR